MRSARDANWPPRGGYILLGRHPWPRYNRRMGSRTHRFRRDSSFWLRAIILFGWSALALPLCAGQQSEGLPQSPGVIQSGTADRNMSSANLQPGGHRFWDRTNTLLFAGVGVFRGLDYASTRNFQARGRDEILIPDDVANNSAGFASLEAAGTATSIGISYLLHRTGHHKLERWMSIGHIGVTGFGDVRNYCLKTKHGQ
jgi:hypothetical protein